MADNRLYGRVPKSKDADKERDLEEFQKFLKESDEYATKHQRLHPPKRRKAFDLTNFAPGGQSLGKYAGGSTSRSNPKSAAANQAQQHDNLISHDIGVREFHGETDTETLLAVVRDSVSKMVDLNDPVDEPGFIQPDIFSRRKQTNAERRSASEGSWQEIRNSLMDGYLQWQGDVFADEKCQFCSVCTAEIRCYTCGISTCPKCDHSIHRFNCLHSRAAKLPDGSMEDLLPCQTLDASGAVVDEERYVAMTIRCNRCRHVTVPKAQHTFRVIAVTFDGRQDVYLPSGWCESCGVFTRALTTNDKSTIVSAGFWPGSPTQTQGIYIFMMQLFDFLDAVKSSSPSLSVHAFVNSLDDLTRSRSSAPGISPSAFGDSFSEYRRCKYSLRKHLLFEDFECPACARECHATHIDGNMKLYRFHSTSQSTRPSYFGGDFIYPKEKVSALVLQVRAPGEGRREETDATCGDSSFAAARDKPIRYRTLDETGLCSSCCRHGILLAAVNMYRGEIFAYPLAVQVALAEREIVPRFICQDVVCKYYPWLKKTVTKFPGTQVFKEVVKSEPFLSVFHAKTHNLSCQVLRGGRTVSGSANQTGEEMEQVHADISRLGFVTKRMRPELRDETITLHAAAHNQRKVRDMPAFLYDRLLKTLYEHNKLDELLRSKGRSREALHQLCDTVRSQALRAELQSTPQKLKAEEMLEVQSYTGLPSSDPTQKLKMLLNRHHHWLESQLQKKDVLIAQSLEEIPRVADGSKRRALLRRRVSRLTAEKDIQSEEFTSLQNLLSSNGIFDGHHITIGDTATLSLVEAFNQLLRLEEEVPLLLQELQRHRDYLQKKGRQLDRLLANPASSIAGMPLDPDRYCPSGEDSAANAAFISLLCGHRNECVKQQRELYSYQRSANAVTVSFLEEYVAMASDDEDDESVIETDVFGEFDSEEEEE